MASKRILVTGASGFVGRALCGALVRGGLEVLAAVRDPGSVSGLPCPWIAVGDVGPRTDWRAAVEGVDGITHLAARTHIMHDRSTDPLEAYRYVNLQGSARLAQQAAEAGVRRLVFLSSVKVNGEATIRHGFTENDIPRPRDSYGLSKLEAEKKLAEICSHSETELTVLRPPLIYGPGVKGNILALIRAIDRGIPLPIGAVRNLRTVLGIDNLVAAILLCLDHPDAAGSTFLVGDDRPVSSLELARSIANALGRNTRIISVPVTLLRLAGALFGRSAAVERISSSLVVDSSKIRERLGWRPVRSFEEGVMDMVHWYLTQRH